MSTTLKVPTIHLNGSPADRLRDEYEQAMAAVGKAIDAVNMSAPNARDYYVQGDGAYQAARAEHDERVKRLRAVWDELYAVLINVQDQIDARDVLRAVREEG